MFTEQVNVASSMDVKESSINTHSDISTVDSFRVNSLRSSSNISLPVETADKAVALDEMEIYWVKFDGKIDVAKPDNLKPGDCLRIQDCVKETGSELQKILYKNAQGIVFDNRTDVWRVQWMQKDSVEMKHAEFSVEEFAGFEYALEAAWNCKLEVMKTKNVKFGGEGRRTASCYKSNIQGVSWNNNTQSWQCRIETQGFTFRKTFNIRDFQDTHEPVESARAAAEEVVIEKRRSVLGEEIVKGALTRTGKLKFKKSADLVTKKFEKVNPFEEAKVESFDPFAATPAAAKRSRDDFEDELVGSQSNVDFDQLLLQEESALKRQRVC